MRPPIIVNEHGDVSFFASVQDAEGYLEPIDVRHQEYIAYDSEGRLLELRVQKTRTWFGPERVVLSCPEAEPTHSAELKQLLMDFFINVGVEKAWVSKASLEELVAKGIRDYKTT